MHVLRTAPDLIRRSIRPLKLTRSDSTVSPSGSMDRVSRETCKYLAAELGQPREAVRDAFANSASNVRVVLRRQISNTGNDNDVTKPIARLLGIDDFFAALQTLSLPSALFTLARLYDEIHITVCRAQSKASKASKNEAPNGVSEATSYSVDIRALADSLKKDQGRTNDHILITPGKDRQLQAEWYAVRQMSFDNLPRLKDLADLLPGETASAHAYGGIGGGGGSDVISASLIGRLLRLHGKEMDLLLSTRTWAIGSVGGKGSVMGAKREIYDHGGPARYKGKAVPGTYLVTSKTRTEGRDLEPVPVEYHKSIYIILDQSQSRDEVPVSERADLSDQYRAALSQIDIQTVIVADTGGDVFGADSKVVSTVDQDLRVQKAMSALAKSYNLITAVMAPGVDAPADAPEKALKCGGKVYKPTEKERAMLLDILVREYHMDGSEPDKYPGRYGKTSLALQARLRGAEGWVSLQLPEHIVDTWTNPWSSFVYIRPCMSDIILMPLMGLLPLIDV